MMKSEKRQNRIRNREIRIVTVFFSLLMLAVMANVIRFMNQESEEAINNSYNPRQELLISQNIRGSIYSADMDILAETRTLSDGTEYRFYPYQNLFAHIVGYSTKGKTGIEDSENMNLIYSHSSIGDKIQNELNEEKNMGDSVVTTLDLGLTQVAYDTLGVYSGAIIVTEPKTGKVLALVSKPDFDPNMIVDLWDDLVDDDSSTVLLNRATQGLYPPGSTFKIVSALAYYRAMNGNTSGYSFSCNGSFSKDGAKINCYHGSKHGAEDLKKSFAKSCNSSFANLGLQIPADVWQKTCKDLLFDEKLGTSFPYNLSRFPLKGDETTYDIMQTSIGQGKTQITPLLLNMITSSIANDGVCMTPYVVDHVQSSTGSIVKKNSPQKEKTMMTAEEAAYLTDLMTEVVKSGTASKLNGASYTAAGKTGSAEYNENKEDSHAWFTGFAPTENPQICVTVIVESAGSGGDYAVPIAKRIFDHYFEEENSF